MTSPVIGTLRHRVTLQRPTRTATEGGGATIAWSSAGSMYARIEPVAGREVVTADGVNARVTHKVLIRHRTDIGAEMRFLEGNRALDIRAILALDGRRRWLQCLCEERQP